MIGCFSRTLARRTCAGASIALALAGSPVFASGAQAICKAYRPIEAMSKDLGSKSALVFYVKKDRACAVVMMISEKFDPDGPVPPSAARVRLSLAAGQNMVMDSEDGASVNVACGRDAEVMQVTTGSREEIAALKDGDGLCQLNAANAK